MFKQRNTAVRTDKDGKVAEMGDRQRQYAADRNVCSSADVRKSEFGTRKTV
jgi:hypothetical protein